MSIKPILLDGGLDLVRSPQQAAPGSLRACKNFEVANNRGYREIQGIRAYSGGTANDVVDPYILHSFLGEYGINITGWTVNFAVFNSDGLELRWGQGGDFNASTGDLTSYDGRGFICFGRVLDASDGVIAICNIEGRLPTYGDTITEMAFGSTVGIVGVPILLSDYVKNGDVSIFGSYTNTVDSISALVAEMDMKAQDYAHAWPLPVSPLGSARGVFYFKDRLHVIGDIETRSFTSGSSLPSEGDSFRLYYTGTAPGGSNRTYVVDRVDTESGDWSAGTAAGTIQLVLASTVDNKSTVISPTDCRNETAGVNDPMTVGAVVRSKHAGMWVEGPPEFAAAGSAWVRCDLGHEIRFNEGNSVPTVLNRSNRDIDLELVVTNSSWLTCGTAASTGWASVTNAQGAADGVSTTQSNDGFVRPPILFTNFGFNLPETAVILGVRARVTRRVTGGSARDTHVYLLGVPTQQDKKSSTLWPGVLTAEIYGGRSDLWGTSISASMVNSSDFGLSVEVFNAGATGGNREIDAVEIEVTYKDRSSVVYFYDPVGMSDISTGRVIWYYKEKGEWNPTSSAEGTMTVYELSAPSAIRSGHVIRTASGGGGSVVAICKSAAEKVYHAASNALEANASQWEFTKEFNFFGSRGTEQIGGASGASFAWTWDGNYLIRIRTGINESQDKPRHIAKVGDQLALGYIEGVTNFSDLGYPESFAAIVGGTTGGSSPISDDTTTYSSFAGGAQEVRHGDSVYGILPLADQNTAVFCRNSIQMVVGSGGNLVSRLVPGGSGIIEYTHADIGVPVFLDYRGIGTLSATAAFGDFARGRLSNAVAPWLVPRLQQAGASFLSTAGPIKTEVVRNKNQLRVYFKDRWCLTMTLVGDDFSSPQFTTQYLPFVPATTCTGVTSGGKDMLFLSPFGMAEFGAFSNDLKAEYEADANIVVNSNLYAPAFVYQGDVGTSWDSKLPIDSYVEVNGGAFGKEWQIDKMHSMIVSGQCFGFAPFGAQYATDFDPIDTTITTNVNGGDTSDSGRFVFEERPFSSMVNVKLDGYAFSVQFVSDGSAYGATTTQTSPLKFRPFTLQAIIGFDEALKIRRG